MTVPGPCDDVLDRIVEDVHRHRLTAAETPFDLSDESPTAPAITIDFVEHRTRYDASTFRWSFGIFDRGAAYDATPLAHVLVTKEVMRASGRRLTLDTVNSALRKQLRRAGHLPA